MIGGDWDDGVVVIKLLSKGFGVETFDDDVAGDICWCKLLLLEPAAAAELVALLVVCISRFEFTDDGDVMGGVAAPLREVLMRLVVVVSCIIKSASGGGAKGCCCFCAPLLFSLLLVLPLMGGEEKRE